jgi:FKBP-type peptidyl-prolyl cis-trans isomerase SlyD
MRPQDVASMKISAGCLVSLKVRLFDAQGELLDESGERPLVYLHGGDDIFPRIEAALDGQESGYATSVYLQPEDAFGDDDASLLHVVPLKLLGQDVDLGMKVEGVPGQPADGRIYTVIDLTDDVVVLDGNHPLAGRALRVDVEVLGWSRRPKRCSGMPTARRCPTSSVSAAAAGSSGGNSTRH